MKKLEEMAEEWAKQCVQTRGNPHWHDVRDAFLAGHASRDAEVEKLRAALIEIRMRTCSHKQGCPCCIAAAALDSEKGEGK
jgi:hypothetical protein